MLSICLAIVGNLVPTGSAPAWAVAQDAAKLTVTQRDIGRMGEPWLRLDTAGHTGTVQALAFLPDSHHLCSGGLDKIVQVWDLTALRNAQFRNIGRTFLRERTIRWEVSRGPRGSIYALSAAPNDGLLAIGGYGARAANGDILIVNPSDGKLIRVLVGHLHTICALAFTADGAALVSVDEVGETRLWQRKEWGSSILYRADAETYGSDQAKRIADLASLLGNFRPAVALGSNRFVMPVLMSGPAKELSWQLQVIGLTAPRTARTLPQAHRLQVAALAATPDGKRLASSDRVGNIYLWNLGSNEPPARLQIKPFGRSLAFTPDGKQLVVGTAAGGATQKSQLQVWDVATRKLLRARDLVDHVHAVAVSSDGKRLAYVGGPRHEVFVEHLDEPQPRTAELHGWQRKVFRVAFAKQGPPYQVAFGATYHRTKDFVDDAKLNETFNPATGELTQGVDLDPDAWNTTQATSGNWQVQVSDNKLTIAMLEGNAPRGTIQLDGKWQGRARCYCWIPGQDGRPQALAIGTESQNGIYVYGVVDRGPCPLWRQFRGHQDYVTSVAVSPDGRYLASGAADGMVQFWSLSNFQNGLTMLGRWGAEFAERDGQLIVDKISMAGPLFRRGVREGDTITKIGWKLHDGPGQEATAPRQILARLGDLTSDLQVTFEHERPTRQPKSFNLMSAWQPVASLFATDAGEWAYWTPEGYYDASANGHSLFGWQVNVNRERLPDYFRADQFRKTLERPEVLRQILNAGTIDDAFQLVTAQPHVAEDTLVKQIAAAPKVEILSPRHGEVLPDRATKVQARVFIPSGGKILQSRAFASGVGSANPKIVAVRDRLDEDDPQSQTQEVTYEWDVALPSGPQHLIQVFVATTEQTAAFEQVLVEHAAQALQPAARPKLYVLAVGVGKYADPKIESLKYAVIDAQSIVCSLTRGAAGLYDVVDPVLLKDDQVTRSNWTETFSKFTSKLRTEARPDDLLIVFFAGHGEIDDRTQTYHFICHDAQRSSLLDGTATISWNDFELLADIPCRKLALLDTCHSGAIQGVRQEAKLAIRDFQENVIFTMAAAAGNEGSLESDDWGHGAFTKSVLDGLDGRADHSTDNLVTLNELVSYVGREVPALAKSAGYLQHPTAAPKELLELVVLPMSQHAKNALRTRSRFTSLPR